MGVCGCSMFCCTLLCVHSGVAVILMGKRELIALLNLSSWCLVSCCPFWGGGSVVVDCLFVVAPILGVCGCSIFCCTLLCVHSGVAVVLMGKRELIALLN